MLSRVHRETVDLSSYPDLVVVYLGMRGGMEAVYDDIPQRRGFASFAPVHPARSAMFGSAARRTTSPRSSPRTTSTPPGPGSRFCAQCYGRSRLLAVACADERMLAGRSAPRGVMR